MAEDMTSEQLREWYQRFSKVLLEQADIDVNSVQDLGRVKNFNITRWDVTNADHPDVNMTYAYMPHNGTEPATPAPEVTNPQDREDVQKYLKWMNDNLKPAVTDDQIRQLYNMSREGTLMITSPEHDLKEIRMVHTDQNGRITTTLPASAYRDGKNANLPEDQRLTTPPTPPRSTLDPEVYGLAPKPVKPEEPANMNPGFLSWLGYLLGMNTDYAKKVRYERDMKTFDVEWNAWNDAADNNPNTAEARYDEYRQARREHEEYARNLEVFKSDSLGKFSAIANSVQRMADEPLMQHEQQILLNKHNSTPRGVQQSALKDMNKILGYEERTDRVLRNLTGHDPNVEELTEWLETGVLRKGDYTPQKIDLPQNPHSAETEPEKWAAFQKRWADLSDIAGFAALTDPEITGHPLKPGCTAEESSMLQFGHMLNDLFTHGRKKSDSLLTFLEPARNKAMDALHEYCNGNPEKLGKIFAYGVRQINKDVSILSSLTANSINTAYLAGKLYETLQNEPDLRKASGLTDDELNQAKAAGELHKILVQGVTAKKEIMEHALNKRTMTPDELHRAARDVMFYQDVIKDMYDASAKSDKEIEESDEYRKNMDIRTKCTQKSSQLLKQIKAAKNDGNLALADNLQKQVDQILAQSKIAEFRHNVMKASYPPQDIVLKLLDTKWVNAKKEVMLNMGNARSVGNMSREELGKLFSEQDSRIMKALFTSSRKEAAPRKDAPTIQVQKQKDFGGIVK